MDRPTPNSSDSNGRMPVLFVGHGSPMNAIEDNRWSRGFRDMAANLPKPKAILSISAHWFVDGTFLTDNLQPKTIHDFYGFPQALFDVDYPARGHIDLARKVRGLLDQREGHAKLESGWGLDHGTWSVLVHMYPGADIPVIQLSIDRRIAPSRHLEIGKALAPLRDEGVLIMGSGNLVHNLRDAIGRRGRRANETPAWARDFDAQAAQRLGEHDLEGLASAWPNDEVSRLAHPSPDHWLPLLYVAGAAQRDEPVSFPVEGFDLGSVSMRSVQIG